MLALVSCSSDSGPESDAGSNGTLDGAVDSGVEAGVDLGADVGIDVGPDSGTGVDAGSPIALACETTVPVEMDDVDGYGFPILAVLDDGRAAASFHRTSATPRWVGVSSFDPASGAWTQLPGPPVGDVARTAVTRHGDDVWSFWFEGGGNSFFHRRFDDGSGAWGSTLSFLKQANPLTEPIATTGRGGHVFVAAVDGTISTGLAVRRLTPGASTFEALDVLDDDGLRPASPTVAVSPAGRALVLWQRERIDGWEFALQYFDGSNWIVDENSVPVPSTFGHPAMLVGGVGLDVALSDTGDRGMVAYSSAPGPLVIATRIVDLAGGAPTIGPVETINPNAPAGTPIVTAMTPTGEAIVVWNAVVGVGPSRLLRWAIRAQGAWGSEMADDDDLDVRSFDLAALPTGGFVIVAATVDGRLVLRRIRSDGEMGPWIDVGVDSNAPATPMLGVQADGTVHVVFSQFDIDTTRSSIFHARCR